MMFITKTLKLIILCAEFKIIILQAPGRILYLLILRLLSREAPLWLELRGQDSFCVSQPPRKIDIKVTNLQKGNKTFSRKIPTSYKYCKIVKTTVHVLKHTRIFRVFRKHKAKEIKVEYLRYNNFQFLEIKTL